MTKVDMFIWSIAAVLITALTIAHCQEKKLVDTLGVTCTGFILVLYLLAFFKILSWIDYISIAVLCGCLFWIAENGLFRPILRKLFTAQNLCVIMFIFLIFISQFFRVADNLWDISYGAGDAKSLWLFNGFATKAGNVSPEYGDYPPAVQLFKWFFLHMSTEYREGLGYAGYMILNFVLILPLISRIDEIIPERALSRRQNNDEVGVKLARNKNYYVNDRKLISKYKVRVKDDDATDVQQIDFLRATILFALNIFACAFMILFPSIMGAMCFESTDGAVTMGILFGFILYYIWDKDDDHPVFFATRVGLYGGVMILCRYTGFEWALFSIVFMIICFRYRKKGERFNQASFFDINIKCATCVIAGWAVVTASWFIFSGLNKRVARYSWEGSAIFSEGNVGLFYRLSAKLPQYLKAFVVRPLHTDRFLGIDFSAFAMILVFIVAVYGLCRKNVIDDRLKKYLISYIVGTAAIGYFIILMGHLTIWTFEFKYADVINIAKSIASLGAPFTTGFTILITGICLKSVEEEQNSAAVTESVVVEREQASHIKSMRIIYGLLTLFILLTCDYGACYNGFVGYWEKLGETKAYNNQMIDEDAKNFVSLVNSTKELEQKRILYIRDAADVKRESEPYISYATVPAAVFYGAVTPDTSEEYLEKLISASGAKYLYVDDIEDTGELFGAICNGEYVNRKLYRILPDGKIEAYYVTMEE